MTFIPAVASPDDVLGTNPTASNQSAGFRRVYQACENCRQKKQKCMLGDPGSPKPPCQACRRANLLSSQAKAKRPSTPVNLEGTSKRETRYDSKSIQKHTITKLPVTVKNAAISPQPVWQTFMGSPEPVVGIRENSCNNNYDSARGFDPERSIAYDQQASAQKLATFPLRNTSDAIRLLDQADGMSDGSVSNVSAGEDSLEASASMPTFFLLREGLIDETTICRLFGFYVRSVHPILPFMSYRRACTTKQHVLAMSNREPYFMAAILVVTAFLTGDQALHNSLWQRVQCLFSEVAIKGTNASVEVIEGLILLSEYPPNMGHDSGLGLEDRMSWMTVGTILKKLECGQKTGMITTSAIVTGVKLLGTIVIALIGKSQFASAKHSGIEHLHADPAEDFPEMRYMPGVQEDFAAYLQCLVHMTHILSNAHDLLYSSKSFSIALAKAEHYYKHIDEFSETLSVFRDRWRKKLWLTYPMNECVWISFADILRIAIGRLQPSKALSLLPLRFFLFLSHASVFLLKAAVIVPLLQSQKRVILRLIKAVTRCMSTASSGSEHPGIRYSSALDSLLRRTCRGQDLQTPSFTCSTSPQTGLDTNADWVEASTIYALSGENVQTSIPESREYPFIAERPFQDLAANIDAFLDTAEGIKDVDYSLDIDTSDLSTLFLPSDPFGLLFLDSNGEFVDSTNKNSNIM
ncbi:hypothetical protein HDV62DRAFT_383120 [Trichoderma sp. SZMC 28011]